jgi:predicted Zn-dependent protease
MARITCHGPLQDPDDPEVRALAARALDAATAAGAQYADVRVTAERTRHISSALAVDETCQVYIGVRALCGGGWGFASSGRCDPEMAVRLGREAAEQAKATVWDRRGAVMLDNTPPSESGEWHTPVQRDPFTVAPGEMCDFLHEVIHTPERLGLDDVTVSSELTFRRQAKLFAATTGAIQRQTCYTAGPSELTVTWSVPRSTRQLQIMAPLVPRESGGYECVTDAWSDERIVQLVAETRTQLTLGVITIGRYPMVFDAATTAALVQSTFGYATELDRVRGDEVNTVGASYLTPASLGTTVASPLVSVQGTRSLSRGPSLVRWDDDGVAVTPFALITNGRLISFATSRELIPELASDRAINTPTVNGSLSAALASRGGRSTGCSVAESAANLPLVRPPDLILQPAAGSTSFADLVAVIPRGVAVLRGNIQTDERQANGQGMGALYEIRNGQLGAFLGSRALFSFKTRELWNNVLTLGGTVSAELHSFTSTKGEPTQSASHGVVAVPMTVNDVVLRTNDAF